MRSRFAGKKPIEAMGGRREISRDRGLRCLVFPSMILKRLSIPVFLFIVYNIRDSGRFVNETVHYEKEKIS